MSLYGTEGATYGVAALCDDIRQTLAAVFPPVWIAGEAQRVRQHRRGHLYLELVEKGEGDRVVAKLEAVVWKSTWQRVARELRRAGHEIVDGQEIRCLVDVDFYGPFGRLQLVVREIDAVWALGKLEQRRRETLAALEAAGLLDRNAAVPLPALPLDIALVTAEGSAAYHDFVSSLGASGYGFRVTCLPAAVQGVGAETELVAALGAAEGLAVDAVVVVRGGGSRTDLAAFDSRAVAEAIARSPRPVLTGLGHETDEAIADRVAHRALKTPTGAAEFLVDRVRTEETRLARLAEGLRRQARAPIARHGDRVEAAARRLSAARHPVRREAARLEALAGVLRRRAAEQLRRSGRDLDAATTRLVGGAARALTRGEAALAGVGERLVPAARSRLRETEAVLAGWERLVEEISPARVLARGFSITRDTTGATIRDPAAVATGDLVETEVAGGRFRSRVEAEKR